MKLRISHNTWPRFAVVLLLVASLVVAFGFWLQVGSESDPATRRMRSLAEQLVAELVSEGELPVAIYGDNIETFLPHLVKRKQELFAEEQEVINSIGKLVEAEYSESEFSGLQCRDPRKVKHFAVIAPTVEGKQIPIAVDIVDWDPDFPHSRYGYGTRNVLKAELAELFGSR